MRDTGPPCIPAGPHGPLEPTRRAARRRAGAGGWTRVFPAPRLTILPLIPRFVRTFSRPEASARPSCKQVRLAGIRCGRCAGMSASDTEVGQRWTLPRDPLSELRPTPAPDSASRLLPLWPARGV